MDIEDHGSLALLCAIALVSGCASTSIPAKPTGPYHMITIDSPQSQVWVDSRFNLVSDYDLPEGKGWLYTDYEGQEDQEFVWVYAGPSDSAQWPPEQSGRVKAIDSVTGVAFEELGPVQVSAMGIDKLASHAGIGSPDCALANTTVYKGDSGRYLITTYLEGLRCNLAFSGGDPITKLGESLFQNRAHAVIKVKPR